jgi:GNAT superfamily N-acetyltransferase
LPNRDDVPVNGTTIRAFREDDLEEVRKLVLTTIELSYSGVYSTRAILFFQEYHSVENIRADASRGQTVVALENGSIIGTGTLLGNNIRRVFVLPGVQGKGLGGRIMEELEQRAAEAGLKAVELDSSTVSIDFYRRRGYTAGERDFIELEGGERLDYLPMQKTISPVALLQTLASGAEDRGPASDLHHDQ